MSLLDANQDLARAKRNVFVLVLAQATLGAQMPLIFIAGALAGQSLASNPCYATVPLSMIVFGSMTTAPWLSQVMQRFGRQAGFVTGCVAGAISAMVCAYALVIQSFPLLILGAYISGIYMSAQGFYRFAAVDTAPDAYRGRAISYVMAAGLAAAVIGPTLFKMTSDAMVIPFLGSFLAAVAINVVGVLLFFFLDIPKLPPNVAKSDRGRGRWQLIRTPRIGVAMIVAMVSYSLMTLVMTSAPLAVVGCGFAQSDAANVVSAHMLAMFVPSFFTGHLVEKFGSARIMSVGLVFLGISALIGLAGIDLVNFFATLMLLGLGWNFGLIGATAMLTASHTPEERGRVQGLNDFLVFGTVTVASTPALAANTMSGSPAAGWFSVNLVVFPLLVLTAGCLFWLYRYEKHSDVKSFR